MDTQATKPGKIDRRLEGDPIQVGDTSLQPVVRLTGLVGYGGGQNGGGGGWVTLKPQEVIVRTGGSEKRLELPDPTAAALRGIMAAGLAVAAVAWPMTILALIRRFRASTGK